MKLTKRILALVMVLCTVAAWMIPGVSAETTGSDVKFDFTSSFNGRYFSYGAETDLLKSLDTGYGTDNTWKFYRTADGKTVCTALNAYSHLDSSAGRGFMMYNTNTDGSYDYMAIEFQAPAVKGTYTLDLSWCFKSHIADAGAYIIEIPAENYATRDDMPKQDSDKALALNTIDLSKVSGNATLVPFTGTNTVDLDPNGRYAIVFFIKNDGSTGYIYANSFTLKYVPSYDYNVTYYANYEDASPAEVADSENATLTAVEKTITLDAPFSRSGYFFVGWATTADGEVVYRAGDTITLTSAAASVDLYAVWSNAEIPLKYDFTTGYTGRYLSYNAEQALLTDLEAGYLVNNFWKFYRTADGKTVTTARNSYGHFDITEGRGLYLNNAHSVTGGDYSYLALEFKAPAVKGTYALDLSYCFKGNLSEAGAYILEIPAENYASLADLPKQDSSEAKAHHAVDVSKIFGNNTQVAFTGTNVVELDPNNRYVIVFYMQTSSTSGYVWVNNFSLAYQEPEATIGSNSFATVEEAVAEAVSGNTIKLNVNADILDLNLGENITLDLNGKTLTVSGVVAAGNAFITDTANGEGLLAAANNGVLKAPAGQVALWDNTTDAEGYRVFNYTFSNYGDGIYEGSNAGTTAVNKTYKVFDGEANGAYVKATAPDYFDAYAQKGWRFEATTATYNLLKNQWHWGTSYGYAMNSSGTPTSAFRFLAPGAGSMTFTLNYHTHTRGTSDADIYIIPATAIDNAILDAHGITAAEAGEVIADAIKAEIADNNWDEANATAQSYMNTINAAITAAIANETPVIDGMNFNGDGKGTVTGTYDFGEEPVDEYLLVIKANVAVAGYGSSYIWDFSFNREAKEATMAQTFWSTLQFTNAKAYTLIAASGLEAGFDMTWEGEGFTAPAPRDFRLDNSIITDWANTQAGDLDNVYGFYVRVSGFEAAGAGTLKGTPYILLNGEKISASTTTYNYTAE